MNQEELQLPPQVPGTFPGIDRAIMLLGSRTKNELGSKAKLELEQLIGSYPDTHQAAEWKAALTKLRKVLLSSPTNR